MRFYRAVKRTICSLGRSRRLGLRLLSRGPCVFLQRCKTHLGFSTSITMSTGARHHEHHVAHVAQGGRFAGLKTQKAFAKRVLGHLSRIRASCRGAFRGARKTHRLPSRCDSTRSRVQGLRARKTYAWTMEKCILPLAFKQLDCVISGRAVLGRKFLGRACRTPGRAARRS